MSYKFDKTTENLKEFVNDNKTEIQMRCDALLNQVFEPVRQYNKKTILRSETFDLLMSCANIALNFIKEICIKHSIDFWLAFIRKLPLILSDWSDEWIPYATLSILKYSNWNKDTALGQVHRDNTFGVVFSFTYEDLFDCCMIALISRVLADINCMNRWCSKGAFVEHRGDGILELNIPNNIKKAVEHYERRRPEFSIFADEGIFASNSLPKIDMFIKKPLFICGKPNPPLNSAILKESGESYRIKYYPKPVNEHSFLELIRPYEEAIEDLFGIKVDSIMHVLHVFSYLITQSIPLPNGAIDDFTFEYSHEDKKFVHKFSFMLNLCRRGLVRFPLNHLKASLSSLYIFPYSDSIDCAIKLVDQFFDAFYLNSKHRDEIDVINLQPLPLIYSSPGGQCYFDFMWVTDFLRWLIVRSREWYSSQHGDRFTLALKKFIDRSVKNAKIIGHKKTYRDRFGKSFEVDLLILCDNILYAIECKAYSKSRLYWLGDISAINKRTQKIREAVSQAKKAAESLQEYIKSGNSDLPNVLNIRWILCLPTQEYLNPLDKFGLLYKDIPCVCTPEEFLKYLKICTKEI